MVKSYYILEQLPPPGDRLMLRLEPSVGYRWIPMDPQGLKTWASRWIAGPDHCGRRRQVPGEPEPWHHQGLIFGQSCWNKRSGVCFSQSRRAYEISAICTNSKFLHWPWFSQTFQRQTWKAIDFLKPLLQGVVLKKSEFDLVRFPGISGHFRLVSHINTRPGSAQKGSLLLVRVG